jgi:hypothetical protein
VENCEIDEKNIVGQFWHFSCSSIQCCIEKSFEMQMTGECLDKKVMSAKGAPPLLLEIF